MNVLLFGATGMIGQGALRECLAAADVARVVAVVRTPLAVEHPKLRVVVHHDLSDLGAIADALTGHDACLCCLGVSSAGMSEAKYTAVTYDLTLAVARAVLAHSPGAVFMYVSGAGTDATERGRTMWARVKGRTENALLALPFRAVYMLRPGYIQPLDGIAAKTRLYRVAYGALGWLYPLLWRVAKDHVTTTRELGQAMLTLARGGPTERVLEAPALVALGRGR